MKSSAFPSAPFDDEEEGGAGDRESEETNETESKRGRMWRVGVVVDGRGIAHDDPQVPVAGGGGGDGPGPALYCQLPVARSLLPCILPGTQIYQLQ